MCVIAMYLYLDIFEKVGHILECLESNWAMLSDNEARYKTNIYNSAAARFWH